MVGVGVDVDVGVSSAHVSDHLKNAVLKATDADCDHQNFSCSNLKSFVAALRNARSFT